MTETAVLILFLLLGKKGLEYLLVEDVKSFERILLHDFYTNEENIDNLLLGTSHVFCDLNPGILDEINGKNNFNLATSAQPLIASYYLLREADQRNRLSGVYLDLNPAFMLEEEGAEGNWKEPDRLVTSWQVMDQMPFSWNKLCWILDSTEPGYQYMSVFPPARYKKKLLDPEHLASQLRGKLQDGYRNYADVASYVHKGFARRENVWEGIYYKKADREQETKYLSGLTEEYLAKIIEYCADRDIRLVLYSNPVSDWNLYYVGDYDGFVEQVTDFAAGYGLEYYDFNLCREECLDLSDPQYWSDDNHMNCFGAEVYTEFWGNFVNDMENGRIRREDVFYDSYSQKLENMEERIFGVIVEEASGEEKKGYLTDFASDPDGWRVFRVSTADSLKDSKAEFYLYTVDSETGQEGNVREWSEDGIYVIPADMENFSIRIRVRVSGAGSGYEEVTVAYQAG